MGRDSLDGDTGDRWDTCTCIANYVLVFLRDLKLNKSCSSICEQPTPASKQRESVQQANMAGDTTCPHIIAVTLVTLRLSHEVRISDLPDLWEALGSKVLPLPWQILFPPSPVTRLPHIHDPFTTPQVPSVTPASVLSNSYPTLTHAKVGGSTSFF